MLAQRERAAALATSSSGGGESGHRPLSNQLTLELCKRGKDPEDKSSTRRRRVDVRPLSGEDAEADPAVGKLLDEVDKISEVPTQPVELVDDDDIAFSCRFETGVEARALFPDTRRLILVDVLAADAGVAKRVSLQVQVLRTIGLRNPRVADQHKRLQNDRFCDT